MEWQHEKVMAMGCFLSCTGKEQTGFLPVSPVWKDGDWAFLWPHVHPPRVLGYQVRKTKPKSWKESEILEMKLLQFSHVLNFWIASWQSSTPHCQGSWQGPLSTFSVSNFSASNAPLHPTPGWDPPLSKFHSKLIYSQGCPPGCFISHPELKQIHSSRKTMNKFAAELHTLNCNKGFLRSYYY